MYEDLRNKYNPEGSILRLEQYKLLEVMVEFDAFCKAHNLDYSLHAGTLLGAVRHSGFIPWDDDADIFVDRCVFDKLVSLCHNG